MEKLTNLTKFIQENEHLVEETVSQHSFQENSKQKGRRRVKLKLISSADIARRQTQPSKPITDNKYTLTDDTIYCDDVEGAFRESGNASGQSEGILTITGEPEHGEKSQEQAEIDVESVTNSMESIIDRRLSTTFHKWFHLTRMNRKTRQWRQKMRLKQLVCSMYSSNDCDDAPLHLGSMHAWLNQNRTSLIANEGKMQFAFSYHKK